MKKPCSNGNLPSAEGGTTQAPPWIAPARPLRRAGAPYLDGGGPLSLYPGPNAGCREAPIVNFQPPTPYAVRIPGRVGPTPSAVCTWRVDRVLNRRNRPPADTAPATVAVPCKVGAALRGSRALRPKQPRPQDASASARCPRSGWVGELRPAGQWMDRGIVSASAGLAPPSRKPSRPGATNNSGPEPWEGAEARGRAGQAAQFGPEIERLGGGLTGGQATRGGLLAGGDELDAPPG